MNNVGLFPLPVPGDPAGRTPRHAARRRLLLAISVLLCSAVLAAGTLVLLTWPDEEPPLVLDEPYAVIWGRTFTRPVEIAADQVRLRRVTIRAAGPAAIRVRPGVAGAVVEDTEIHCVGRATDGIVPGGYSAVRVATHGCRRSFAQHPGAAATVVDSEQDGRPYSPDGPASAGPDPDLPSPGTPSPGTPSPGASSPGTPPAGTPPTPIGHWPGPGSAGVPAGTSLTSSGPLDLRRPGEVVSGLDIRGCVAVRATDVTIRRSRIRCDSPAVAVHLRGAGANLLLEDVEIDGRGRSAAAVCCGSYTLRRVEVHHVLDGPHLGSRATVEESWLHDLVRVPGVPGDLLLVTGGSRLVVRRNRLDAYRPSTGDPFGACLMIGSRPGPAVRDLLVEGNYCDGGTYAIGVRPDLVAAGIVIRANRFGRHHRSGVIARPDHRGVRWDRGSNRWFDTGLPVLR
ncbi:hypothetical protein [Plantactinospora sp. CA-290183]|uniref:hypothetical protein n=1 Tax=Plantactinospora sp. CA-290183 TaxID=3240006 RepID=UPI003D8E6DBC